MIVSTEGDIGDAIYLLCILSQLKDGPHDLLLQASGGTKWKGDDGVRKGYEIFGPLAQAQPYIRECRIADGGKDHVDWRSAGFRGEDYVRGRTLMDAHLVHLMKTHNVGHNFNAVMPWLLNINEDRRAKGKVVINRTGRYRNSAFQWDEVVNFYRHRLLFVGLEHEWREFIAYYGYVQFVPTKNMLEVARLIKASELFIGNQSSSYAVAEGLKHRSIQETSLSFPDCIYNRENAQYVHNGACVLPALAGMKADKVLEMNKGSMSEYSTKTAPPGRWQFPGMKPKEGFKKACDVVMTLHGMQGLSRQEVEQEVLRHNVERCPGWQQPIVNVAVMVALAQAGIDHNGLPKS